MPLLEKKLPDPGIGLFPEEDYEAENERFREEYERLFARDINPRDLLPPTEDQYMNTAVDATNLLFGDEMASVGVNLDKEGFHWDLETAKNFWVEHPIRASLSTLTTLVPMAKVLTKGARASRIAGITDDMIMNAGMVDEVTDLALMADKEKDILRQQLWTLTQRRDLEEKIELGTASLREKSIYNVNKWFGNSYLEQTDMKILPAARMEWQRSINDLLSKNGLINDFLKTMPNDEAVGTQIARYLDNPDLLSEVPKKYQSWAIRLADELRNTQSTMVAEGLIAQEEASKIGPIWFSMVREGTKRDMGNLTTVVERAADGNARVLTVPRTTSPNLLERKMSKAEVTAHLQKQQAAELLTAGKTDEAASLLKGEEFSDVRSLIKEGNKKAAIRLLKTDGAVDFTPESLTFNSLYTQKQLLATYRTLRDVALNPDITKTSEQIIAMGPRAQKNWMKLDDLDGSDRLIRMVETKKGQAIDELGYVPKKLYGEMRELIGMDKTNWKGGVNDLVSAIVAMYKTSKTAHSFPTHLQNTLGNMFFLANVGVNPMSKEFWGLQRLSWRAIRAMQTAARKGVGKETAFELIKGEKLPSLIGKKSISVVDELNSNELRDLLELTSMVRAEGIGVLDNITRNAKGGPTKAIVDGYQKLLKKGKLEFASDAYMAEDGMAKMAYFLHLRQRGLSRTAALNEVGRRLPMYNTVGEVPAMLRSAVIPWVTFPVEATRILKNNLDDHPLKTMLLLQLPELLQLGAYTAGRQGLLGATQMNAQEIEERKRMLPTWAYRPASFMTPWTDPNGDFRAMMMDWLPYASAMPPSISPEAPLMKKLPFGADEPFPIGGAIYYALTGKDAWGREMPTEGPMGKAANMILNTIGLIAPPIMQKYVFNPTEPQFGYALLQDLGKAVNPYTNKEGDPVLDLFMNRIVGFKTYAASPEQQIANEQFTKRDLQALRGRYTREWSALLKSNDLQGASEKMRDIHSTFVQQWGDPGLAQQKFSQWLSTHWKDLANHPQLRNMSKEELQLRIQDTQAAGPIRTRAARELYETYRAELGRRGRRSNGGRTNPLIPGLSFSPGKGGLPGMAKIGL